MHKLELELDEGAYAHLLLLSVEWGEQPSARIREIVAQWVFGDSASRIAAAPLLMASSDKKLVCSVL